MGGAQQACGCSLGMGSMGCGSLFWLGWAIEALPGGMATGGGGCMLCFGAWSGLTGLTPWLGCLGPAGGLLLLPSCSPAASKGHPTDTSS